MDCTLQDRITTFRGHQNPASAIPTASSYGFEAVPLSLERSSARHLATGANISRDVDGVFGHFPVSRFGAAVCANSCSLIVASPVECLFRSKYHLPLGNEVIQVSDMVALRFAEVNTAMFSLIKFYLIWPGDVEGVSYIYRQQLCLFFRPTLKT